MRSLQDPPNIFSCAAPDFGSQEESIREEERMSDFHNLIDRADDLVQETLLRAVAKARESSLVAGGHRHQGLALHHHAQSICQHGAAREPRAGDGRHRADVICACCHDGSNSVAPVARARKGTWLPSRRAARGSAACRSGRHVLRDGRPDPQRASRHYTLTPIARPGCAAPSDGPAGRTPFGDRFWSRAPASRGLDGPLTQFSFGYLVSRSRSLSPFTCSMSFNGMQTGLS